VVLLDLDLADGIPAPLKISTLRVREKYAQAGREARTKLDLHRRAVEDGLLTAAGQD
jgi:hypothetical protein